MSDELLRELRRIADALERIATQPSGTLPPRQRTVRPPRSREQVHAEVRAKLRRAGGSDR